MRRGRTHVDKLGEGRVAPLFLLKLVLAVELVRAILDIGRKVGDHVEEDVANLVDDVGLLLPLVEQVDQAHVDCVDLEHVPEDLSDKVFSPCLGNDVGRAQRLDPELRRRRRRREGDGQIPSRHDTRRRDGETETNVAEVLEVAHKVALGVEDLVDALLALLLAVARRVNHLLRHRVDPQRPRLLRRERRAGVSVFREPRGSRSAAAHS